MAGVLDEVEVGIPDYEFSDGLQRLGGQQHHCRVLCGAASGDMIFELGDGLKPHVRRKLLQRTVMFLLCSDLESCNYISVAG